MPLSDVKIGSTQKSISPHDCVVRAEFVEEMPVLRQTQHEQ
jgi:hypothetical protein